MKQLGMGSGFEKFSKTTRREQFLAEMERIVPWSELCAVVEPHYPTGEGGRPPRELEQMLRIYLLQQWFNLSDPGVEEALYDSRCMQAFARIDLAEQPVPDETTVCRFRHHRMGSGHRYPSCCSQRRSARWIEERWLMPVILVECGRSWSKALMDEGKDRTKLPILQGTALVSSARPIRMHHSYPRSDGFLR